MNYGMLGAAAVLALGAAVAANAQATDRSQIRALLEQQAASASGSGAKVEDTRGVGLRFKNKSVTGAPEEVAAARPQRDESAARPVAAGDPPVVPEDMAVNLRITFETNSAFIRPSAARLLGELCAALTDMPSDMTFNILGHADRSGSPEYNRRLSAARAQEVARHLTDECGIDAARLETYGLGDTRLLDGAPAVSEAQRRVEVQVSRSNI